MFIKKKPAFSLIDSYTLSVRKNYENLRQAWAKCLIILSQTSKLMVEYISSCELVYICRKLCVCVFIFWNFALFSLIDSYMFCCLKTWPLTTPARFKLLNNHLKVAQPCFRTLFKDCFYLSSQKTVFNYQFFAVFAFIFMHNSCNEILHHWLTKWQSQMIRINK